MQGIKIDLGMKIVTVLGKEIKDLATITNPKKKDGKIKTDEELVAEAKPLILGSVLISMLTSIKPESTLQSALIRRRAVQIANQMEKANKIMEVSLDEITDIMKLLEKSEIKEVQTVGTTIDIIETLISDFKSKKK